jgi:hypothetical protein
VLKLEIRNKNINKSLTLLKEKALKDDFIVAVLVVQKLIRRNDVIPINSHPKNNMIVLPDVTKKTILITKERVNNKNLSTRGS